MGRTAHIRYRRHASGAGKVDFKNPRFLGLFKQVQNQIFRFFIFVVNKNNLTVIKRYIKIFILS
jgi:hypothetical protein